MPQVIFKNVQKQHVQEISVKLPLKLEQVSEIPKDWFTVEHLDISLFENGQCSNGYPIVQINWFDRGLEVKDKIAEVIFQTLKEKGYSDSELFFINLEKQSYYENGERFE